MSTIWASRTFEDGTFSGIRVEEAAIVHQALVELALRADLREALRGRTASLTGWDAAVVASLGALGILPFGRLPESVQGALTFLLDEDVARELAQAADLRAAVQTLLVRLCRHGTSEARCGPREP